MTQPKPETPKRTEISPFPVREETEYPRGGVRQTTDGRWMLSLWSADQVLEVIDEPVFDDRVKAFDYGWLTIGACRMSGVGLNGYPV